MKLVLDTSVLIQNNDWLEAHIDEYEYIICSVAAMELDNQKESSNARRSYMGRTGLRFIDVYEDKLTFVISDVCDNLPSNFDKHNNDNKILSCAIREGALLATKDRGLKIKAKSCNVECLPIDDSENEIYKGYRILELNTETQEDNEVLATIYEDSFYIEELNENEYLIIKDTSSPIYNMVDGEEEFLGYKTIDILRNSFGSLVKLKLPPKSVIKPLNDLQKCTLDLLNNDNCPIKIIAGGFGSGKTLLSTKMAIYKTIEKGKYGSILALRNPSVEGEQIGFLPGGKDEKTNDFFKPFIQHLEQGEFEAHTLEMQGILRKEIIGYIKGLSIGETFIVVDEAEDLNFKQLKMCGSRIEETSSICFVGDYKQTHDKYVYSSGLLDLIDKTKNTEFAGVVVMEEDLRSDASKVFANI